MSLIAQRLHIRCFLEGIEIPLISCVVQCNINAPAAASVNVVPLDEVMELKPRTMVHLFYYDFSSDEQVDIDDFSKYKLLYVGETVGINYNKTPTGRSCVLQCTDLSTNWDLCYQYMLTYGPNGNFITEESANWAGENAIFNNIVDGHSAVLARYLEKTPQTIGLKNIKGLLGGIISLIEGLGGIANHRLGVNDYFTISEFKNKTMQQVVAEQDDDTAQKLFDSKEFYEWLEHGVTTLGELCTIRDMINMLFKYIYYESVPVTCPYYIQGDAQTPDTDEETKASLVVNNLNDAINALVEIQATDVARFAAKTVERTLERAHFSLLIVTGGSPYSARLEPTKQQSKEIEKALSYIEHAQEALKTANGNVTTTLAKTKKASANIDKDINSAIATLRKAVEEKPHKDAKDVKVDRLNSFIFRPQCFFVAAPRCNVIFPEHECQFSYDRNYLSEITRLRLQSGMMFGIDSEKLLAEFAYAPAMKEIQQLAKEQGTRGIRALLPWEKYTGIRPKFEYVNEINYIANKKQKQLTKNIIGTAVSYKQKAANFNFFKHRFAGRGINISSKFNPFIVCGFPTLIIDKPFIVDRDQLKNMINRKEIELKSTDPADIVSNIKEIATKMGAPTQYVGMIQALTHSLDSNSGGTTMMSISHARTHKITEDDFLVAFQQQKSAEADVVLKSTFLDAEELSRQGDARLLQFLIDATPQDMLTNKVDKKKKPIPKTKMIDRPKLQIDGLDINTPTVTFNKSQTVLDLLYGTGETVTQKADDGKTIRVPGRYSNVKPGTTGPLGGKIKVMQLLTDEIIKIPVNMGQVRGDNNTRKKKGTPTSQKQKIAWKQMIIYEEVPSGNQNKLLPVEEVLRPGWFSPWYSNLYIGDKVYKPFFGTGSIVDQIVFDSPEGLSIQGVGAERNQILDILNDKSTLVENVQKLSQSQLFDIPDVETSANILAFQYGEVRRLGLDAQRFINSYTSRPIATLPQIFGSPNLDYEVVGNKLQIKEVDGPKGPEKGIPGFHSTAITKEGKNLLGLVDNPDLEYPMGNQKGRTKIAKSLDPRPDRRAAVLKYVEKLRGDGGLVIGLQG